MVQLLLLFVLLPLLAELKPVAVLHPLVDGLQVSAVFATKVIPPFWLVWYRIAKGCTICALNALPKAKTIRSVVILRSPFITLLFECMKHLQ